MQPANLGQHEQEQFTTTVQGIQEKSIKALLHLPHRAKRERKLSFIQNLPLHDAHKQMVTSNIPVCVFNTQNQTAPTSFFKASKVIEQN